MEEILKVFENNHIDPPWSYVLVLGLDALAIGAVAWCVWEVLRARQAAEQAKRIEESAVEPFEGARFVAGHVELANGADTAVRVTIQQEGTQREYKGQWSHTWTEVDREVVAVPFYLRTAKGERIRVEPPLDVMLVDSLDQMESVEVSSRKRRAELTPAERAVIEGRLTRGPDPELQGTNATYRTAATVGWVMKADKRRGMSVSTESLSRRHELRARAFLKTAILVTLIHVAAFGILMPYRFRLLFGRSVIADYGGKQFYMTRNNKGRETVHHAVVVSYTDEAQRIYKERLDIDRTDYEVLPFSAGGHIWLRYVPNHHPFSALGRGSSVNGPLSIIYLGILAAGISFVVRAMKHRRWYEGHLIDKGTGVLPAPLNQRFADTRIVRERIEQASPIADVPPISTNFMQ